MAKYSLAHAFMGTSFATFFDAKDLLPSVIRLKNDDDKEKFIIDTLKPGDELFLELGGPADRVALVAAFRGVLVRRIPTFKLGNKVAVLGSLEGRGWKVGDEIASGGETSDDLMVRKARAMAIALAANEDREAFYESREDDQVILQLKQLYRSYRAMQKTLLASYQRLVASMQDRYLLELARDPKRRAENDDLFVKNAVSAEVTLRAIRAMLDYIPQDEREAFEAKLGLEKIMKGRRFMKRQAVKKLLRAVVDAMMEGGVMSPFLMEMKKTLKDIEKLLKKHPVYVQVFESLPGCGPLIAARMIASIVDIRRFPSRAALRSYAGYSHFEDGSRQRRRAGHVSNWNMELKQAVYLWCQQTLKMTKSPWRAHLDKLRAYELYKLLRERQNQVRQDDLRDASGNLYEILPLALQERRVTSRHPVTVEDLGVMAAHVDVLRKRAGVKPPKATDDEEESESAETEGEEIAENAKDPVLAKLTRGVKQSALDKAMRRLGQDMLNKHVTSHWKRVLGMPDPLERRRRPLKEGEDATLMPTIRTPGMPEPTADVAAE